LLEAAGRAGYWRIVANPRQADQWEAVTDGRDAY